MLTIDILRESGADVDSGLARCMGMEDFYLNLVGKALQDNNFTVLKEKINAKDLDGAFEAAHALKGVLGNLSLEPMYSTVCEITELLRSRSDVDYAPYLKTLDDQKAVLDKEIG